MSGIGNECKPLAHGTLTKNAVFKQEINALLNHSVPVFLSRKAIKSTRAFSCGGTAAGPRAPSPFSSVQ